MPEGLNTFLRLRARLASIRDQDGWLLAGLEFQMQDSSMVGDLEELREKGVIAEIRQQGNLVFPSTWKTGSLELKIDCGKLPGYFETHDSLISSHPNDPPDEVVVWLQNAARERGYRAACALLQFLKGKVEVWDSTQRRFFLVDQQAVEVPLIYCSDQTLKLEELVIRLEKFLDADHLDADVRWAFFRKASIRLLRDVPKDSRLGCLLENLANVWERAQQDYGLYLERFSFEDLLKNFDEKRLRFVSDLNQVLGSIQTALIAVPVAFFLIAEKFKPADGLIGQNAILAAGGLVFFALLLVLSLNQGKTLDGVRRALIDFETEQTRKQTDRSDRLNSLIICTRSHLRRVVQLLWTVRCLLVAFGLVIVATLMWCSIPAWQKQLPYLPADKEASGQTNSPPRSKVVQPARP